MKLTKTLRNIGLSAGLVSLLGLAPSSSQSYSPRSNVEELAKMTKATGIREEDPNHKGLFVYRVEFPLTGEKLRKKLYCVVQYEDFGGFFSKNKSDGKFGENDALSINMYDANLYNEVRSLSHLRGFRDVGLNGFLSKPYGELLTRVLVVPVGLSKDWTKNLLEELDSEYNDFVDIALANLEREIVKTKTPRK